MKKDSLWTLPVVVRGTIVAFVIASLCLVPSTIYGQSFNCTTLIGFSQTANWANTPEFQVQIDDARWQTRIAGGAWLGRIANPDDVIWSPSALRSPCVNGSTTPDRVVLTSTLSYFETDVNRTVDYLRAAIATIRMKYPSVQATVLQPVVGGPGHAVCGSGLTRVRASVNHSFLDQAILNVLGDAPDLVAGPSPEVETCDDYSDTTGHLDPPPSFARGYVGGYVGSWFAEPPPTSTLPPPPTTTSTTLFVGSCKLLGQLGCSPSIPCCPGHGTCTHFRYGDQCR